MACSSYNADLLEHSTTNDAASADAATMDAAPPRDARTDDARAPTDAGRDDAGSTLPIPDGAIDAADTGELPPPDAGGDDDDAGGLDACPSDPGKVAAGVCGCGVPDVDDDGIASCVGLRDALLHRYRFEGAGTTATDSKGSAHGTVVGTALADTGALALAGGTSDQYVDLPNGLISGLTNVTIEAWVTWAGGNPWQRIFDFGDSTAPDEGTQDMGRTHLFIAPLASGDGTNLLALFRTTAGATIVESTAPLATNVVKHVAVVIDDGADTMTLYLDGQLAASTALTARLSEINDINNWIGRSQWLADDELGGVVHEFRIYAAALGAPQLATSFAAGPDPAFLEP